MGQWLWRPNFSPFEDDPKKDLKASSVLKRRAHFGLYFLLRGGPSAPSSKRSCIILIIIATLISSKPSPSSSPSSYIMIMIVIIISSMMVVTRSGMYTVSMFAKHVKRVAPRIAAVCCLRDLCSAFNATSNASESQLLNRGYRVSGCRGRLGNME